MEPNISNVVTLLVLDHLLSLGFIYLLVALLVGKVIITRRPPPDTPEEHVEG